MAPVDVLYAATQSAADLLGIGDEVGSITAGKRADLTVVSGEPLQFADWSIDSVWKSGRQAAG